MNFNNMIKKIKNLFNKTYIKISSIIFILLISVFFIISSKNKKLQLSYVTNIVRVFIQDNCADCEELKKYINLNKNKYKNVDIRIFNLTTSREVQRMFFGLVEQLNVPNSKLETPFIIINNFYLIGYNSKNLKLFEKALNQLNNGFSPNL